uniref:Si:dkey-16p21.8 n=2 Tax=Percomorphaceae TaxID=1489872 RepID=A0A3P9JB63_ORYLA
MSDSETAAAPAEAPVPAACTSIKADLDKSVAEKGAEGCKDLMEAFAACVKNAAEGTS